MYHDKTIDLFLSVIREFLNGRERPAIQDAARLGELYTLAARHDVAHLVGEVLGAGCDAEARKPFLQAKQRAIFRYAKQSHERERMYALLEAEGIPYIPLKGSVIADLYPAAWQRTSCDIDILVHREDLEQAQRAFEERLGYRFNKLSEHDVSLFAPSGVHLELHYDLHEANLTTELFWAEATPAEPDGLRKVLPATVQLLYHISHMAKHFQNGGCGFRPFVDLWLMLRKLTYDENALRETLEQHGLERFSGMVFDLLECWFGEGEATPFLKTVSEYILTAGAYGSLQNHVALGRRKKGGRVSYFFSRLFLSREALQYPYPILQKHGWLLPYYQVHRWYRLLRDGKWKRITSELGTNQTMDEAYLKMIDDLMTELNF